ncbi:MAG: VOC family protein [Rhizobiaceae bacterium]
MEPTVYLNFNGDCLEAMTFYARVLGGEVSGVFTNKDAPVDSRMPGDGDAVMNMAVKIGNTIMMASDAPAPYYEAPRGFSVALSPPSKAEAERVFSELSADARKVSMPFGETFWAEAFAMFTDRFGTPWIINFAGSKAPG